MIDIRFLRENPEAVKENIRKKFQDAKLPLVDEVVDLDQKRRAAIAEVESLKAARNKLSKANGPLYQRKLCILKFLADVFLDEMCIRDRQTVLHRLTGV